MKPIHRTVIAMLLVSVSAGVMLYAQAPAAGAAKAASKAKAAPKSTSGPQATLGQLMKGIFFPNSNVIFAAQNEDPAKVAPAKDPSLATDPLQSAYGKWEAVENSALALADGAVLLTQPGRRCSNGKPVPLANADWAKLVRGLRDAGMTVYKAAQAKDMDKIVDAADVMTTACANCHDKYHEVADRCMAGK
jgi:hypothetical protein